MKTIKLTMVALFATVGLVACGGEEEKEASKESAPVIVNPAPTQEKPDEKTKLNIDRENNSVGFENENFDIDLKGEDDKK